MLIIFKEKFYIYVSLQVTLDIFQNLDVSEIAICCTFIFFAITALIMLFGYCLIDDQLTQQVLKRNNKQ